jgi:signal transduction histidine kinase
MALTFAGLIYVQFLYMNNMVRMRNDQFDESVRRSLYAVSSMLEHEEAQHFLEEYVSGLDGDFTAAASTSSGSLTAATSAGQIQIGNVGSTAAATTGQAPITRAGQIGAKSTSKPSLQEALRGQYLYQKGMIDDVIFNIISRSSSRPITHRADSAVVRNFLRFELDNNGLKMPYDFAVTNRNHAVIYRTAGFPAESAQELVANPEVYFQPLFPNDPINKINYLSVYFPTKKNYIFSSIRFMLPSLAFTLILMLIFIYAITTAFRQKKVNEMKTDFINNMTHELKTPISSISLAGQMLADPTVRKSDTMMRHVTEVINEDTKRLRFLVEKVLQLSLYYNQKSALRLTEVDANKAIAGITHTFKLKVEKYGGKITADLSAANAIVEVDEMHFTNVIFNLLDNAVKYRREDAPLELTVRTVTNSAHSHLKIIISDTGIGIKKDDLRKIFEKFYRVNTGNRHDVKGFGLGLAYVHKMITEFGGEIYAESELGHGTTFTITLPLLEGTEEDDDDNLNSQSTHTENNN